MDNKAIENMRQDYRLAELDESKLAEDPIDQFSNWFDEAVAAAIEEPNAMTLATVDQFNQPDARIVLLKGVESAGFIFFTHYTSVKGQQIADNNNVALVFHWHELERQVRIKGTCTKLSETASEQYFHQRPRKSQLGALASPQSQSLSSRLELEQRFNELEAQYTEGTMIPRPDSWGGYCVTPSVVEFWQGRRSRLHDRVQYAYANQQWQKQRLAP